MENFSEGDKKTNGAEVTKILRDIPTIYRDIFGHKMANFVPFPLIFLKVLRNSIRRIGLNAGELPIFCIFSLSLRVTERIKFRRKFCRYLPILRAVMLILSTPGGISRVQEWRIWRLSSGQILDIRKSKSHYEPLGSPSAEWNNSAKGNGFPFDSGIPFCHHGYNTPFLKRGSSTANQKSATKKWAHP
ncbi:hypothetical protein [Blastopirellula marina]|uniref:hypothetical protein n=1 Tax=Blastopirellula marina TaxID=124 RepID=UPI0011B02D36|nr:hypothetical protein [Blastopirellula marina]